MFSKKPLSSDAKGFSFLGGIYVPITITIEVRF